MLNKIIDRVGFKEFFAVLVFLLVAAISGFAMYTNNNAILDGIMVIVNMSMGAIIGLFYKSQSTKEENETK